ncbi:MAG: SDR family NAD(P)-dependent oxidoreductase [Sphaerobacter sp.]|nr:SDR family NAD(P)-dependent oxidoreductase [Sphaerobacter sp.]
MPLTDRVAIITGGTGALGQAVVPAFLAAGATVVVPYRREAAFTALQQQRGDLAHRLHGHAADVTDPAAVAGFVTTVLAQHGRIDILLNLAGGYEGGAFLETDLDQWERLARLNVQSVLVCTRAVLPHLVAQGSGRIVTVGARAALEPASGSSAYAAAKAAVVTLTRAIAREIRTTGVTINCIAPSTIDTPANRQAMPKADPSRWVRPQQIASLLVYLCSDPASAINGAVIPVYGQL